MRESANVVMLGPGLDVRGGVSGVERLLLNALPEEVHATHIATMVEGGKWTKAMTFAQSLAKLTMQLQPPPRRGAHSFRQRREQHPQDHPGAHCAGSRRQRHHARAWRRLSEALDEDVGPASASHHARHATARASEWSCSARRGARSSNPSAFRSIASSCCRIRWCCRSPCPSVPTTAKFALFISA